MLGLCEYDLHGEQSGCFVHPVFVLKANIQTASSLLCSRVSTFNHPCSTHVLHCVAYFDREKSYRFHGMHFHNLNERTYVAFPECICVLPSREQQVQSSVAILMSARKQQQ